MSQQNDLVSALAGVVEQAQADFSQAQFNDDFPADTKWHYFMAGRILELLLEEGWVPREETEAQIKHMVDRFLQWKLPENFNPDGGISFKRMFNEKTPWPMKNEPVGTNLFNATQAEAMVRYMIERPTDSPKDSTIRSVDSPV